jgi:hypothetical protein
VEVFEVEAIVPRLLVVGLDVGVTRSKRSSAIRSLRREPLQRAAAEDTVSGPLRRAVKAMRQPYEQVCQATGIPFEQLADFMAGGQLASDPLDRLAAAARCELVPRGTEP